MKDSSPHERENKKRFKSFEANLLREYNNLIDSLDPEVIDKANLICKNALLGMDLDAINNFLAIEKNLKPVFKAALYLSQYQNLSPQKITRIISVLDLEHRIRNTKSILYKKLTKECLQQRLSDNVYTSDLSALEQLREELLSDGDVTDSIGDLPPNKQNQDLLYSIKEQMLRNSMSDLKDLIAVEEKIYKLKNPKKAKELFERSRALVRVFETLGYKEAAQTASLIEDSFYGVYQKLKQEKRNRVFYSLRQILGPIAFTLAIILSGLKIHDYFSNRKNNDELTPNKLLSYELVEGYKPTRFSRGKLQNLESVLDNTPVINTGFTTRRFTTKTIKNRDIPKHISKHSDIPPTLEYAHQLLPAEIFIYVSKTKDSLYVYDTENDQDNLHKVFAFKCITGLNPGPKTHAGDNATPEGAYKVIYNVSTNNPLFGSKAIGLDYPNSYDRSLGRTKTKTILICGTYLSDRELALKEGKDVTFGSVVLKDSDIITLSNYIKNKEEKTCVIIESQLRRLSKEQIMAWQK